MALIATITERNKDKSRHRVQVLSTFKRCIYLVERQSDIDKVRAKDTNFTSASL